jgi:hypothetical protein
LSAALGRRGSWAPRAVALIVIAVHTSFAPCARAWNAHGHMLIALVAYDSLPDTRRAALTTLLSAHPRYREDLLSAVPSSLADARDRERWLFAYAATWPDQLREQPAYRRGTWHYVNLPLYLRPSGLVTCRDARRDFPASVARVLRIDAERRARGQPGIPSGDSILAALPNNQHILADTRASPEARALALSWLLHLVGDAHQPLHGVALFTGERFVTGDRGGNDILVRGRASLHALWDDLLGEGTTLPDLDAALAALGRERQRWRGAVADARRLDVDGWIDEACALSRSAVYTPAVLSAVERFERAAPRGDAPGDVSDKPEVSLNDAYVRHAREKARERAVRAGLRLAALLASVPL